MSSGSVPIFMQHQRGNLHFTTFYSWACDQYSEYSERAHLLAQKLQKSYFAQSWLQTCDCYHKLVDRYERSCLKWKWTFSLLTRCVLIIIRNYTCLLFMGMWLHPPFFGGGPCCSSFKFSVFCFIQRLLKINVGKCDRFIS